jgi:hypothetical protein
MAILHLGKEAPLLEISADALLGLDGLKIMDLGLTKLTFFQEDALQTLVSKLPLKELYLSGVCLKGPFLSALEKNRHLSHLSLAQSSCTNSEHQLESKHLAVLSSCPELIYVTFCNHRNLQAQDLGVLSRIPKLETLAFAHCSWSLEHSKQLTSLNIEDLDLSNNQLTDADLDFLPKRLITLYLDGSQQAFTAEGLCRYFGKARPSLLKHLSLPLTTEKKALYKLYKRGFELTFLRLGSKHFSPGNIHPVCTEKEIRHFSKKMPSLVNFYVNGKQYASSVNLQ